MTFKKRQLYRQIVKKLKVAEDAYLVPEGESYYDVDCLEMHNIRFNKAKKNQNNTVFDTALDVACICFSWEERQRALMTFFSCGDWITSKALKELKTFIDRLPN